MKTVIIQVSGGCADVVSKPDDVEVIVRDYDHDGFCETMKKDDNGDQYREIRFGVSK